MDPSEREREWTRLLEASLDGDAAAYRRLLGMMAPVLRSYARRGLARAGLGEAEAEDVVQETLLAIHLKRSTWDRGRSAGPWLMAIARYKLVDALRRRGRPAVQLDDLAGVLADESGRDAAVEHDAQRMLAGLEERSRRIVQAISIEGSPVRDVAAALGMSEVAVRVSLHRSLKRLARRFRDAEESEP